jgi:dephospho-CoA kinase
MKIIVGLVGEKFAGKDAVANYLADKHNAAHIRFSHILDDILRLLNLPISRRNEVDLGLGLRQIFGRAVLGPAIIKRAEASGADLVVINGIRMDEMENIKNIGAKIIYITAPANTRFERYQKRHEKTDDGVMDFEQFKEQEKELTEIGIPELGKRADFRIDNTGTLEELYEKADKIIQNLKIKV